MVTIKYIEADGREYNVSVDPGRSVMHGAVDNMVEGILAECAGMCACATCHVYVDDQWMDVVGAPGNIEKDMLDSLDGIKSNSRLSCQIKVSEDMDGLVVRLPESQY